MSRRATPFTDPPGYARHRLEKALLHRLVERHHGRSWQHASLAAGHLPAYVQEEFEA